ncbi:MAG: UDP-glucose dehydrogenase family protein [Actinomycetota bacterium]
MRVVIIGTGHVGLVTAATLVALDHDVVAADEDEEKIADLTHGISPFFEPGLPELIGRGTAQGRLRFEVEPAEALAGAEVVFICVGTPARASGEANLVSVERAARGIARHLTGPVVVVEKSTVPAGTADRLSQVLQLERPDLSDEIDVVSNPEFLREGQALEESLHPDRILVGARSPRGFETMRRLYEPLTRQGVRLIETDIPTAELAKHACNAFLATKISYANALARLCERADADVTVVADVMGSDPRIGRAFLDAGLGYGGFCFPKDLQALERLAARLGYDFRLLREVERINDEAVHTTVEKVKDALWNLEDKRIALLGLSFKPGTDDVRFSPALALARRLLEEGANVVGYDPEAETNAKSELPELALASSVYDAIEGAHCMVVCTDWDEFRSLDLDRAKELLAQPIVVDGRNLFDPADMRARGFDYHGTGRGRRRGAY